MEVDKEKIERLKREKAALLAEDKEKSELEKLDEEVRELRAKSRQRKFGPLLKPLAQFGRGLVSVSKDGAKGMKEYSDYNANNAKGTKRKKEPNPLDFS